MDDTLTRRAQRTIAYGFLFFILISMATPFVWMISNTFKEQSEIFQLRPTLIPEEPHLRNYVSLFVDFDFARHFLNSAFIAVVHTASHLFLASLAGFAFAKYTFPLKNFLFLVLLGSMMVPLYTIFIPLFVLVIRLGLVNSYAGVILPGVAGAFGIFFMKQSMESVPNELLDSARIDGASEFRIYLADRAAACASGAGGSGGAGIHGLLERFRLAAGRAAQPGIADAAGGDGGHGEYVPHGIRRRDGGLAAIDVADPVALPRSTEAVSRRASGRRGQAIEALNFTSALWDSHL